MTVRCAVEVGNGVEMVVVERVREVQVGVEGPAGEGREGESTARRTEREWLHGQNETSGEKTAGLEPPPPYERTLGALS